jgi:SAM-dependent methyltransferase
MGTGKKLNIGCGNDPFPGYINLDIVPAGGVDVVADIDRDGLPFADDSLDEIHASHVLAHMHHRSFHETLLELLRVLRQGGRLVVKASYFPSTKWFGDPDHVIPFGWRTFDGYTKFNGKPKFHERWKEHQATNYGVGFPLVMERRWFVFSNFAVLSWIGGIINLFPALYDRFFCYWLPSEEICYELRVDKEDRGVWPRS